MGARYFVTPQKYSEMKRFSVAPGDFLISCSGTIGRIFRVPSNAPPGIINQALLKLTIDESVIDSGYFLQYFRWDRFQNEILDNTQGGAMKNLVGMPIFKSTTIPLPPLREQRRLANALADVDDTIERLASIIVKKDAIKQGILQQLLTGSTRLPGFTGAWDEGRLGDVLTVRHGKNQKAVESPDGLFPILGSGGQIGWARSPLYSEPSVLIGRKGTIDRPQYQAGPFWTVDTLFYTEISQAADPRYLYYMFLTVDWRSMNEASGVPSLSARRVESVAIRVPAIEEQKAIRAVLDDADAEVAVLRERLVKVRNIKRGMMQELLTGRTRLPAAEGGA